MPFNGSGTFVPIAPPNYPAVSGTTISASAFNMFMADLMSNGLSNTVVRDGQGAMTGNLNLGGNRIVGVADPVISTDAATAGYVVGYAAANLILKVGSQTLTGVLTATGFIGPLTGNASGLSTPLALTSGGLGASHANVAAARTTLGVSATGADTTYNARASNLSDVGNAATARTNLGIGSMATRAVTISTAAPSGGADGDVWLRY